ncbi:RidA family protein [Ornithinimicrobium sp. F0845]|uniref:RidA family protein n=1 Tax=Ornithinimicrobium sp. F0845 TaxID=2926412 RepID=UPI001FF12925|nr:RidA family protein [Ornithinimicrobium sp. F0845]MCK0114052.1 RidA family protein [Ornithinimicrobium sp. F0845]
MADSSTRVLISPQDLHPAPGFSHIAIAEGSRVAYVAGQVALGTDFSVIGGDDLRAQTVAAMRNLEIALQAIDASWDQIVRRTVYTTAPQDFETITSGIEEVQGSDEHPAQTIIGVTGLAVAGLMIEIEATVVLR